MKEKTLAPFLKYWPYAEEQEHTTDNLIHRFNGWKNGVETILTFLTSVMEQEEKIIKIQIRFATALEVSEGELGPSSIGAFKTWHQFSTNSHKGYTSTNQQIATLVVTRLEILKAEIKRKLTSYTRDLSSFNKAILKSRQTSYDFIDHHEAEVFEREKANILPSSPHLNRDPWLQERILDQTLKTSVLEENLYQKNMTELFKDMEIFDAHIVEELKRVMEEFALIKSSYWSSLMAQMTITVNAGLQVDQTTYFKEFSKENKLEDESLWKKERTLKDFIRRAPDALQILKVGLLYRKSKMGMGMLVPVLAVLTATGFFHTFPISNKQKSCIEYYQKKDLNRISVANFVDKAKIEDESKFLYEMTKPEHSISLGQPLLSVEMIAEKAGSNFFSIVVQQRKPKTAFKKARELVNAYEFKSLSEADMIEWIAEIQKEYKKLFPAGPPAPLFTSPEDIRESVKSIVSNDPDKSQSQIDESKTLLRSPPVKDSNEAGHLVELDSSTFQPPSSPKETASPPIAA